MAAATDYRQSLLGLGSIGADLAPQIDIASTLAAQPLPTAPQAVLPPDRLSIGDRIRLALGALEDGTAGEAQQRSAIAGRHLSDLYDRLYNHPESDIQPIDPGARPRGLFSRFDPATTRGQFMQQAISRATLAGAPNAAAMQGIVSRGAQQALGNQLFSSDGKPVDPALAAQLLAKARSMGVDISDYSSILEDYQKRSDRENYLGTIADPVERAYAAMAPTQYVFQTLRDRRPQIENMGNGNIAIVDPKTGGYSLISGPRKAPPGWHYRADGSDELVPDIGGPADPSYIARVAGVRRDAIVSRPTASRGGSSGSALNPSKVMGPILAKVAQGQPLSAGEQELYNRYKQGPSNFSFLAPGGMPQIGGQPAPPQTGATRVKSKAELDRLPKGAPYINPSDGRLLYKNY